MSRDFYNAREYKEKQSAIMKENWKKGIFNFTYKREKRKCARKRCGEIFEVKQSDPKIYCCRSCAGKVNNIGRVLSKETKLKIARALTGKENPHKGIIRVPRVEVRCANPKCKKLFIAISLGKRKRKFCSNECAMAIIGGKPTSPKAARGKAGVRKDISKKNGVSSIFHGGGNPTYRFCFAMTLEVLRTKSSRWLNLDRFYVLC